MGLGLFVSLFSFAIDYMRFIFVDRCDSFYISTVISFSMHTCTYHNVFTHSAVNELLDYLHTV